MFVPRCYIIGINTQTNEEFNVLIQMEFLSMDFHSYQNCIMMFRMLMAVEQPSKADFFKKNPKWHNEFNWYEQECHFLFFTIVERQSWIIESLFQFKMLCNTWSGSKSSQNVVHLLKTFNNNWIIWCCLICRLAHSSVFALCEIVFFNHKKSLKNFSFDFYGKFIQKH